MNAVRMTRTDALPLFAREAPHNGTETSRDAAAAIREHLGRLECRVLVYIAGRADGATREEIGAALTMKGDTVRPRVAELVARKLVRENGETRRTTSGRRAAVLVRT